MAKSGLEELDCFDTAADAVNAHINECVMVIKGVLDTPNLLMHVMFV
jgi:hypothetical protein